MSIARRVYHDGKPRYLVRIDVGDPITGGRKRLTVGTFRTKNEAERAEARAKTEQDRGTLLVPNKTTVGELLDRWLEVEVPRTVKPENFESYEIVVRKHLKPAFGNTLVQKLTVEQVETFYAAMQAAGRSTSLIKKCHIRLASALKMAKRWKLVSDNVCDAAKPPRLIYQKAEIWGRGDTAAFLEVAARDGLHPYWSLAVETGARTSELLGVSWEDVDFERSTVMFGHRVIRLLKGTPIVNHGAKTEAGRRTVKLTTDMVEELRRHGVEWKKRRLKAREWANPHDLVFCTASGRPINPANVRRSFNRLIKEAGVKRITPHGMRKTHITATVAAGGNLKAVAARVGHRDVTTTLRTYTHLVPQMEDDLLEIVGQVTPRRSRERAES